MTNAVKMLIQNKVDRYNKANDDCRFPQAKEYLHELKGMQALLKEIGVDMFMEKDLLGNMIVVFENSGH